jgi:hypothetical protein
VFALAGNREDRQGRGDGGAWKLAPEQTLHLIDRADLPRAEVRWPAGSARPPEVHDLLALAEDN